MNRFITTIVSTLSVAFFSLSALAQSGFNNPEVLECLESNAKNHGLSAITVIDAVNLAIGEGDMIRFMITAEGELFFLDDSSQLFAAVVIQPLGSGDPEVLICSSCIDALRTRTSQIVFITDDISADDARQNNFEFIWAENPEQLLEELADEYAEMHPELEKAKRQLLRQYAGPKRKKAKPKAKAPRDIAVINSGFSY